MTFFRNICFAQNSSTSWKLSFWLIPKKKIMIRFSKENRKRHFGGYFGRFTQKNPRTNKNSCLRKHMQKVGKIQEPLFRKIESWKISRIAGFRAWQKLFRDYFVCNIIWKMIDPSLLPALFVAFRTITGKFNNIKNKMADKIKLDAMKIIASASSISMELQNKLPI